MSTDYVPRHGDTIRITAKVVRNLHHIDGPPTMRYSTESPRLAELIEAGDVELVARAEPDWRMGDIGQHIETGKLYIFADPNDQLCWFEPTGLDWFKRGELAGKLERMTLAPEGEAKDVNQHAHICPITASVTRHAWPCTNKHHLSSTYGAYLTCSEHS